MKIRCAQTRTIAGTSLVEVIVAIAIIAVMAGGILGSLSYGFYTMQSARENQRATQIMLERTEAIRLYNWSQVNSNGFIPATFSDVYDPQATGAAQGVVYNGTLVKTNVGAMMGASDYRTNLMQITLNLTWNTRTITRSRSLSTYISRDGVQNYVY